MNGTYWLFNWFDANGVISLSTAEDSLSIPVRIEELREVAAQATGSSPIQVDGETSILAGRGLDLTGKLDCSTSRCRQRQVDELFRKAWHYFDRIIVDDVVAHELMVHWDQPAARLKERLLSHIEVLLYLRKIGAEDLLEFRQKPIACVTHWKLHAEEAGLSNIIDVAEALVPKLAKEASIDIHAEPKGRAHFLFKHPEFEIRYHGDIKLSGVGKKLTEATRRAVVREVLRNYIPHLTGDVVAARTSGVPLGSTIWLHNELLVAESEVALPTNVAFNIELPILQGISVDTLLAVRSDEHESFQRFRDSLRLAIKQRIETAPSHRAKELSEQIRLDVIQPELRRIRDRLAAAERTLAKKTALGIVMGALVTTCGIFAGLPVPASIAAGCGAASTTETGAVTKYLEEKQQASLSDMYFLWEAVKHVAHDL